MSEKPIEGWDLPVSTGARKFHYFHDGRSLCYNWREADGLMGPTVTESSAKLMPTKSKCSVCRRQLEIMRKAGAGKWRRGK